MGCDIHLTSEFQNSNGSWIVAEGPLRVWRDYSAFSILCGVRNRVVLRQISSRPRGLPLDVSRFTENILSESGAKHSYSWITEEEFCEYFPWKSEPAEMSHFAIIGWSVVRMYDFAPLRFVFGFDN